MFSTSDADGDIQLVGQSSCVSVVKITHKHTQALTYKMLHVGIAATENAHRATSGRFRMSTRCTVDMEVVGGGWREQGGVGVEM